MEVIWAVSSTFSVENASTADGWTAGKGLST